MHVTYNILPTFKTHLNFLNIERNEVFLIYIITPIIHTL